MTVRHLVISGGPLHDFDATTAALVEIADREGFDSVIPPDPTEALDLLDDPGWDLVTVNALLWSMPAERHAHLRDRWAHHLDGRHADALVRHVRVGGGLLACHTAPICFDGDARWRSLVGAAWSWDRSGHGPLAAATVTPTAAALRHPVTTGVAEFDVVDEVYANLDLDDDLVPLLVSTVEDEQQPLLWTRTVGRGRVVVDLLGHDAGSTRARPHTTLLRRAMRWLAAEEGR